MKLLIRQGNLVDPDKGTCGIGDILMEHGTVRTVGGRISPPSGAEVVEAAGLVVCPGLVDMHVHLREPGFPHKETIETGAAAAAHGGFTSIACMANTKPVLDCAEQLELVAKRAEAACGVRIWPIAAMTVGQRGQELTRFEELKRAGAVALSDDGVPVQNAAVMRQALTRARGQNLTILSHCEDAELVKDYAVNEGAVSERLGLPGRPAIAEELMVARDAMLAEETGGAVHICHVSTAGSVEIIRRYKQKGVRITCETCPQYFTLTEDEVLLQGALARMNPPLRTRRDVDAILEGLLDGTIDAIATDHAPHSPEEKRRPLTEAPSGMIGLETALAVSLTELYHTGKMALADLVRKMTVNPARILNLPHAGLAEGGPGDILIFDPDETWVVDPARFLSKARNTPFAGRTLKGAVRCVLVNGAVVYRGS